MVKLCPAPQLMESHSDFTVRSWLHGLTIIEVQQEPVVPLVPPPVTHCCPMPPLPAQSSSQMPSKSPSNAVPCQRAQSICLPSLCNTEYRRQTGREDTEIALVQKSTCSPKTPIRNVTQLNRFLSLAGQMLGLKNVKYSMAVVTQLQQRIESKVKVAYKYLILFYISISVINCRKSGLYIAVGSKVSTKRTDIKYSK